MTAATNGPIVWWVLGAMFSILLLAGGAWLAALHTSVSGLQSTASSQGERLAHMESRMQSTDERLSRIEDKIDQILGQIGRA